MVIKEESMNNYNSKSIDILLFEDNPGDAQPSRRNARGIQ